MIARRLVGGLAIAVVVLSSGSGAALAQVSVEGRREAIRLEVHDATVRDVLAALHDRFDLRYRSSSALEQRKTGVFNGSLDRVVARILDSYDFAIKITPQGVEVLVLERQGSAAVVLAESGPGPILRPPLTTAEVKRYEHEHVR
jgi:hypothetical protein